ncbi:hypothetical protein AWN76_015720 [Rhodothermaceae bacterium RA]|nr:hypothetical protein AWN76_015720 [Rhodothermaceae bacterium RA]
MTGRPGREGEARSYETSRPEVCRRPGYVPEPRAADFLSASGITISPPSCSAVPGCRPSDGPKAPLSRPGQVFDDASPRLNDQKQIERSVIVMRKCMLVAILALLAGLSPIQARMAGAVSLTDCTAGVEPLSTRNTGSNATLIVTAATSTGSTTCVVVYGERGQVVGYGQIQNGRGAVIVIGDDVMTEAVEGAREGESLRIEGQGVTSVTDLLTGEPVADLRYRADALWRAEVAGPEQPTAWELAQNYPNPFNPTTTIRYAVPEPAEVTLTVYNVLGEAVATLADGPHAPGSYEVRLDAGSLASGLYIYRLTAGRHQATRTMTLVK